MNDFERLCAAFTRRCEEMGFYPMDLPVETGLLAVLREMRSPTAKLLNAALPRAKAHHGQIYCDFQTVIDHFIAQAEASESEAEG